MVVLSRADLGILRGGGGGGSGPEFFKGWGGGRVQGPVSLSARKFMSSNPS